MSYYILGYNHSPGHYFLYYTVGRSKEESDYIPGYNQSLGTTSLITSQADINWAGGRRLQGSFACSEDTIANDSEATIAALRSKHPDPHPESIFPEAISGSAMTVSEGDVMQAIRSFPKSSAGSPDGLRPQHLQDMVGASAGAGGAMLLQSLTAFTSLVLAGDIPVETRPFFFGASLTALNKKDGEVRPIAVGCTLRRLVAKVASRSVMERMGQYLAPQLGYGTPLGAEAAVHASRSYLHLLPYDHVLLKPDFRNAFNTVIRDKILAAARDMVPKIFPLIFACYSAPSTLFFRDTSLLSAEDVQQGDPLGPLLFCLVIHGPVGTAAEIRALPLLPG